MNEVFESVKEAADGYNFEYSKKVNGEKKQLRDYEAAAAEAESRAAAALKDNDPEEWEKADRDKTAAMSRARFVKQHIALLENDKLMPPEEYNKLVDRISAEYGRVTLEFFDKIKTLHAEIFKELLAFIAFEKEARTAAGVLQSAGGDRSQGYEKPIIHDANIRYLFDDGFVTKYMFAKVCGKFISDQDPIYKFIKVATSASRKGNRS